MARSSGFLARIAVGAIVMAHLMALLAGAARAADITLMCPPPMRAVLTDLFAAFERQSSRQVAVIFAPSKAIIARLEAGEKADVAVLTAAAADGLIKADKLARRVALARSTIGVAVPHGVPKPDIGSTEAFRRTLLAARSFARNDGADSGIYMKGLIERLGIAEQMKPKTTLVPSGFVADSTCVAVSGASVGFGQTPAAARAMPGDESGGKPDTSSLRQVNRESGGRRAIADAVGIACRRAQA